MHVLRYLEGDSIQTDGQVGSPTAGSALVDVARVPITLNITGVHSRGVLLDHSARDAALAACDAFDAECLAQAERTPMRVFVANRSPNSLLLGRTPGATDPGGPSDIPIFYDSIPLSEGPSGVFAGHVIDPKGEVVPRVFVACFDSNLLYVIDPKTDSVESTLVTGRGPQSLAFEVSNDGDSHPRAIVYVAQFTDSYLSAISLDQRHPETYGATLATFGIPTPPRAAK
jgi:YVTN family beta-propeller protein